MSVDKLVDSAQLDSDLTTVANAIRTKGGTSAQLAFPSGFITALDNISGGAKSVFKLQNFLVPSGKWVSANSFPNVLKTGGCIHYAFTLQTNTNTSNDFALVCFGVGNLNVWSPGASNPSAYMNVGKNSNTTYLYLRGAGNTSYSMNSRADANGRVDVKWYSDRFVNVLTGESTSYGTNVTAFMTALLNHDYISVGINQSAPLAGAVVTLFALEET